MLRCRQMWHGLQDHARWRADDALQLVLAAQVRRQLAKALLSGEIVDGDAVVVDLDEAQDRLTVTSRAHASSSSSS